MSLTQRLPPEMREKLEDEAVRRGEDPDVLLLALVDSSLSRLTVAPGLYEIKSTPKDEDFNDEAERFRRWADGQPRRGVPVIPLEALDREHIYGDHA